MQINYYYYYYYYYVPYGSTAVLVVLRYHGSTVVPPNTTLYLMRYRYRRSNFRYRTTLTPRKLPDLGIFPISWEFKDRP